MAPFRYALHALAEAAARGVDVRVTLADVRTNAAPHVPVNEPAIRFSTARGVEVVVLGREAGGRKSHCNYWLLDRRLYAVTNGNLTPNAFVGDGDRTMPGRAKGSVTTTSSRCSSSAPRTGFYDAWFDPY